MVNGVSVFCTYSCERRMLSTFRRPIYCWLSASIIDSFRWCKVSVRSALMMCCWLLKLLSSAIRPDGRSMLTTLHGDALMYLTSEANPPASGLFSPEPNSPSMMRVSALSVGGSKLVDTSVNSILLSFSMRFLFAAQSSDRWLCMLKR